MLENVNCRKRNGRFLCEDEIHHRDVSRNAENMTARAVLGHFSRFSNELLTKTAIF